MDAKKKKNKKKKGNQSRSTEDAKANSEEVAMEEPNNGSKLEENHFTLNSVNADVHGVGVLESDLEHDKHKTYEAQCVKLQQEVGKVLYEKNLWLQKQVGLEEKIKVLQNEIQSRAKKEAILEEKVNDCQIGIKKLMEGEAILEDKIKIMEGIKDSLNLKEISLKKMIARVEEGNTALQIQVKELEGSRNTMIEENQRLMESIAGMALRIQHLEWKDTSCGNSKEWMTELHGEKISVDQIEVANSPISKQTSEDAELARKVSESYAGPDQHAPAAEVSSATKLNHERMPGETATGNHNHVSEIQEMSDLDERVKESVGIQEKLTSDNGNDDLASETLVQSGPTPELDQPRISEEIVTVPLEEIENDDDKSQGITFDNKPERVPLSDAPLIGAPFRLVSYVAKYVSGADLANQNSSKSGS